MESAEISLSIDQFVSGSVPTQAHIVALQRELLQLPQADIRTEHIFLPGLYERRIIVPPLTALTGAEHKCDYRVRLERGVIAVNTEEGMKLLTGPCEFEAKAGMQRAGFVFEEEVSWVDIYPNPDDCQNIPVLEERLFVIPECGLGENRVRKGLHQITTGETACPLG